MSNLFGVSLPTPTKRQFAATFHVFKHLSLSIQSILSAVASLALLLIFSRNVTLQAIMNLLMRFGVFFRNCWNFSAV